MSFFQMALTDTFPFFLSYRLDSSKMIVSLLDCGLWWPILLLSRCVICLIVSAARRSIAIATCKLVISAIHWLILHIEGKAYDCFSFSYSSAKKDWLCGHHLVLQNHENFSEEFLLLKGSVYPWRFNIENPTSSQPWIDVCYEGILNTR